MLPNKVIILERKTNNSPQNIIFKNNQSKSSDKKILQTLFGYACNSWKCGQVSSSAVLGDKNCAFLFSDPFRVMEALRKTMEPQHPGYFPEPVPEIVEKQTVAKERAALRVRIWTVQNEMRGVLGRTIAGAARRILDSDDSGQIEFN